MKTLFGLVFLIHLVIGIPQINLYLIDEKYHNDIQQHCLYINTLVKDTSDSEHIIPYCLTEFTSKSIEINEENNFARKYEFNQLKQLNITSEQ
ncbi:hypothetical protein I4U23_022670 [Adineta vaga]|nr:hypothetical protein I4U23_022670 [Adineta vaga]